MKKMSRWFAALLALVLALGCLQMTAMADYSGDLENVDLIYWAAGNPDQKDEAMVMEQLNAIALDALNVNMKITFVTFGEAAEKFSKAMAAQERIDLAWNGWVASTQDLVNMGALLPMDELLDEYGPDLKAALGERLLAAHACADGKVYQYPAWQGMVGRRSFFMFPKSKIDATVGEDWVKELEELMYANWDKNGVENHMVVWKKVEEYLEALKEKDMLGLGYNPILDSLESWYDSKSALPIGNYGFIEMWDDTFTVKAGAEGEWGRESAKLKAEWFDKGYIRSDIASLDAAGVDPREGYTDPVSDNCYIMQGHNGFTDDVSKETAMVAREIYTVHTNPYCFTELGSATGTVIPYTCAEPERAMMFMNWLVSDDEKAIEWYNMFSYGLEDVHYAWNEDHSAIEVFGGNSQAEGDWAYGQRPWTLGTMKNAYSCPVYPAEYYDELVALQDVAYTSPLLGFSFDNTDVETECSLLDSVGTEYGDMLNRGYVGSADIEAKYQEYVDKMYANGLQDVIDAMQEQVTAFVTEYGRTW